MSSFKLGVILGAHQQPEQLAVLMKALQHPRVRVYLHIDRRVDVQPFEQEFARAGISNDEITWITRIATPWGTDRMVRVELEGMKLALADGCDYMIIISGQDFPLRPVEEIVAFFEANRDLTYIDHFPLPHGPWKLGGRARTDFYTYVISGRPYTSFPLNDETRAMIAGFNRKGRALNVVLRAWTLTKPKRRFPDYARPIGGEHWMNLTAEAAAFTLAFIERHPDYARYQANTASATEMYIQSIVVGTEFADSHQIVNDDLRFILWDESDSNHPRNLTLADAAAMFSSSDLFARKVSANHDPELFVALRERLGV